MILFWYRHEMAKREETVKAAWLQLESEMVRQTESLPEVMRVMALLPKLQRPVYVQHKGREANLWSLVLEDMRRRNEEIVTAREALLSAPTPRDRLLAYSKLQELLFFFRTINERYQEGLCHPDLLKAQNVLAEASKRIYDAGRQYEEAHREYNAYVLPFPNRVVARWSGFGHNGDYFSPEAYAAVAVGTPPCQN
jgi:hypothetical protein